MAKSVTVVEYKKNGTNYRSTLDGKLPSRSECERQLLFQRQIHVPERNIVRFAHETRRAS